MFCTGTILESIIQKRLRGWGLGSSCRALGIQALGSVPSTIKRKRERERERERRERLREVV
jgi:hypothetical protein